MDVVSNSSVQKDRLTLGDTVPQEVSKEGTDNNIYHREESQSIRKRNEEKKKPWM